MCQPGGRGRLVPRRPCRTGITLLALQKGRGALGRQAAGLGEHSVEEDFGRHQGGECWPSGEGGSQRRMSQHPQAPGELGETAQGPKPGPEVPR